MARQPAGGFDEPWVTRWLFGSASAAWIWLTVRLYLGYEWHSSGIDKLRGGWLSDDGAALRGFVSFALQGAAKGPHSAVNYGWYAAFLRWLDRSGAPTLSPVITIAETAIGVALIIGLFTGFAAFLAGMLTMSFGLAGVAGVNPVFFLFEVLLLLAWRNAGYLGLDRWVLPALGTPWQPGPVFRQRAREPRREVTGEPA